MSEELINIPKGALAPAGLDAFKGKQNEGFEDVTPDDLVLARLALCQDLTAQHKKSKPNYIDGLEVGMMFNTVTEQIYPQKVEFIPLKKSASRIYFKDIKEGGGIICRSFNGIDGGTLSETCATCPNSTFGPKNEKPKCNEFMNFPALLLPRFEPIGVSFKSTALSIASAWLTKMQYKSLNFGLPMYCQVWEISVAEQTKNNNTFQAPVLKWKRWVTPDEGAYAEKQLAFIKTRVVKMHDEDTQEAVNEEVPF